MSLVHLDVLLNDVTPLHSRLERKARYQYGHFYSLKGF